MIRPDGSIIALIPVFAARTIGTLVSTERIAAIAKEYVEANLRMHRAEIEEAFRKMMNGSTNRLVKAFAGAVENALTEDWGFELKVAVERKPQGAVLYTKGYINNVGGEEIANRAYELMDDGVRTLLLNLRETKIVNSIGISILIEIIEKMIDKGGKIAFCCLTPVIHKTFQIMGLANYASIFENEEAAVKELGL